MNIHPSFENVPDLRVAEVLSEPLTKGGFTFAMAHDGSNPEANSDHTYPPAPAMVSTVTAAFLEQDGQTVRRYVFHDELEKGYEPKYQDVVDRYGRHVTQYHGLFSLINRFPKNFGLEPTSYRFGALGKWCVDLANRQGNRLLAAHVINVDSRTKAVMDALAYPDAVNEEFPLLMRHMYEPIAYAEGSGHLEAADLSLPEDFKEIMGLYMRMDPSAKQHSGMAPAGLLPPVSYVRQALKMRPKR